MYLSAKQQLTLLINSPTLGNKLCADCGGMNPQWASISFATFICLSCAGVHRGFGVHISFVRSVSMDTWSEEQLKRMKLGGNEPCNTFITSYEPTEDGGYTTNMSIYDKYHCWAATQYREKLTAALQGRDWSPSTPPPKGDPVDSFEESPARTGSAQSLRKSRAASRANSTGPSALSRQQSSSPGAFTLPDKTTNEIYFNSLGQANASRSADLPPSQGGKYTGFGSTPTPPSSEHPSFGLSSAAAPSFAEIQTDPITALGKGWSLFSSAVAGATRAVHENVIQPGLEKVTDPNFRKDVTEYVATTAGAANEFGKRQMGVDVGGLVSNLGVAGSSSARGAYTSLSGSNGRGWQDGDDDDHHGSSALYAASGDDDFFAEFNDDHSSKPVYASTPAGKSVPQKDDWKEDEWKDF